MESWTCICGNSVRADLLTCPQCGQKLKIAGEVTGVQHEKVSNLTYAEFLNAIEDSPAPRGLKPSNLKRRGSTKSHLVVRLNYFSRIPQRITSRFKRLLRIRLTRKFALFLFALIVFGSGGIFFANPAIFPAPVGRVYAKVELEIIKVLPISKPYKLGFEEGQIMTDPFGIGDTSKLLSVMASYWGGSYSSDFSQIQKMSQPKNDALKKEAKALWPLTGMAAGIINSKTAEDAFANGFVSGYRSKIGTLVKSNFYQISTRSSR
jgi:hypothetical protein